MPRLRSLASLTRPLQQAVRAAPVPLLVLRLPHFERIAWRQGKAAARRFERATIAAFLTACARTLRVGDLTAHTRGTDVFAIAMSAPSRESRRISSLDCRSVLERVAAGMALGTDMRVETGWTLLRELDAGYTVERAAEAALEAGARDRERYEFFAAIGHELRTPLTSIRGYLETLLEENVDCTTSRRFLDTARREALRMGRLLDGMFEFSLLDLSAQALMMCGCCVDEQMRLARDVVAPLAAQRGIVVVLTAGESVCAGVEPDACLQLLVNLLDNAIKYGRDGGIVEMHAHARGDEVVIAVEDDGPGIAPDERESIFGLRVRGTQSGGRPGTGIGLAIVKLIAERAGGSVVVGTSRLGGARFEAALPLRAESAMRAS